jgi:DNA-binding MarR family transcriptional regulator
LVYVIFILIFIIIVMDIETKRIMILSKNKRIVLVALQKEPKLMQELVKETGIRIQNLSRTLQELCKMDVVLQQNPKARKGKIYTLTQKGGQYLDELKKSGFV